MKALIIGATGATGKELVKILLADERFTSVEIFVRKELALKNPKLNVHVVDFDRPDSWKNLVKGDVAFSCMGTTLKAAGSKEAQYKVDYTYQYQFAEAAKENDVPHFILVSALGSNPKSPVFYSKMKGELEEAIKKLNFKALTIFEPGILDRENSDRPTEVIGTKLLKAVTGLGILENYKPLPVSTLASAMRNAAVSSTVGLLVVKAGAIFKFGK